MQRYFYLPRHKLYRGDRYSYLWPFSQALAATIGVARIPGIGHTYTRDVRARLRGLARYWDASSRPPGYDGQVVPPLGKGGTKYYDDNEWIGLELVRRYRMVGKTRDLKRAERLFRLTVHGWDRDPSHSCPGGVLFSQASDNTDRNIVSNAPGAELGLELYRLTRQPYYGGWARQMYDWVDRCLPATNGLYPDHIGFDGSRDGTLWTYNQGTMVGASTLLYRITGDRRYLERAKTVAGAALAHFRPQRLDAGPPYFLAIFFHNLLVLGATTGDHSYRRVVRAYGNRAWRRIRDRRTGLFRFGPSGGVQLLDQASMVQIYALLASPTRTEL